MANWSSSSRKATVSPTEATPTNEEFADENPDQFVKVEIRTRVPVDLAPEITGGLNSSVQVQEMSLANLGNKFDWIKDDLAKETYHDLIRYKENEPGDIDVREVIALLHVFNLDIFPNDVNAEEYPTAAYNNKGTVLKRFLADQSSYQKLRPILKDILVLHDLIAYEARDKYNEGGGGRGGGLAVIERRERGGFTFPFIGQKSEFRLRDAALYPILGAFRWLVESTPKSGTFRWRGGFEAVKDVWGSTGRELMRATHRSSDSVGHKMTVLGKDNAHWGNLYKTVVVQQLMFDRDGSRNRRPIS